jgi:hypothetical protein
MRYSVEDQECGILLELEDSDQGVDLTKDGLGDLCLTVAVRAMLAHAADEESPSGERWARLKARTEQAKGHGLIGVASGDMLDPTHWEPGDRQVEPAFASWRYAGHKGKALGFHLGRPPVQPARPLFGWSDEAKQICTLLVQAAGVN